MTPYPHLFSPLDIGPVTSRNRLFQTCHTKLFGQDATDSQRTVDYYAERARGGAGLLFTDARNVHPTSTIGLPRYAYGYLPGSEVSARRLTDAIHEHGALAFTQLSHAGLNGAGDFADDLRVLWGPSALKSPVHGETAKAMEQEDIDELIATWVRTAELCREGGFDGIEIHLAHSYLLHQFLSPIFNHRTDEYGGSWENRTRLPFAVIDAVRAATGRDWAIGVRLSLTDFIDGALDVDDAVRLARELEARGGIDFINVSAAVYHNLSRAAAPSDAPDGYLVEMTAQVKQAVERIPVFTVGGITDPAHAERIVASGQADMVAMTRPMIADPELANKAREGRDDEIVRCVRSNQGCMGRVIRGLPASCTVNPAAGREARLGEQTLVRAATPGRWLVVGGGPAGMRAAATLARRGHAVTLLEREAKLGGQVNLLLRTPGRDTFAAIVANLATALDKRGVEVRLGEAATAETVVDHGADGVVLATGARPSSTGYSSFNPLAERFAGIERDDVLSPWDVLLERVEIGRRVVVLDDDGSRYSAGVAEVLLDRGHEVELLCPFPMLFPGTVGTQDMGELYGRLMGKGLRHRTGWWGFGFDGTAVQAANLFTQRPEAIAADAVVLAIGREAEDDLYRELKGRVAQLHRIGDCVAPRKLDQAIYEGELAGREQWSWDERAIDDGTLERWREVPAGAVA